jgi:hypothetical protein
VSEVSNTVNPLGFDPKALKRKYAEERARRLRPEGTDQYIPVSDRYPQMLEDPFDRAPFTRAAVAEDIDVLVVAAACRGS